MPQDPPDRAEQLHDEHRRKVWDDLKSGSENFDKYMVTLSSGALGVSLTFLKDVVPLKEAVCRSLLVASWISFILCILTTLISFRLSIHALEEMLPCLDAYYLKGEEDAFNRHLKSFSSRAVDWCANLGIIFFVLGLIFTMMFVGSNIFREATHVSSDERIEKVVIGDLGKAIKPVPMTQLTDRFDEGMKPPAMTPVRPPAPTPQPSQPQSPKK